jgi:hypothetical protein
MKVLIQHLAALRTSVLEVKRQQQKPQRPHVFLKAPFLKRTGEVFNANTTQDQTVSVSTQRGVLSLRPSRGIYVAGNSRG